MSTYMIHELLFFFFSVGTGILLAFLYDWLRLVRRLFSINERWNSVTDFIYWIAGTILIFVMIYEKNDGVLRGYAFLGLFGGMVGYLMLVRDHFVNFLFQLCAIPIKIMKKPLKRLLFVFRRCKIRLSRLKRKLKYSIKTNYRASWKKRLHRSEKRSEEK